MKIQINITTGFYLQVQKPDTSYLYTPGQLFTEDENLFIVSELGYKLIGPIVLPVQTESYILKVDIVGQMWLLVSGNWTLIGQIKGVFFIKPEDLEDVGDGYYKETFESGVPIIDNPGEGPLTNAKTYGFLQGYGKARPLVVLNINKIRQIGNFILKMRGIYANMLLHPDLYPSPPFILNDFLDNVEALVAAEAEVYTQIRGKVQARNQAYDLVLDNAHTLLNYVQTLADRADTLEEAIRLILSSGFDLKKSPVTAKSDLQAKNIIPSGTVKLTAKAVAGAGAYEWQKSSDAINWTELPGTIKATTTVKDLTPGTYAYFRCRAVLRTGYTDWTQIVSLIIT
ncbi:MAG: hypothetical protein KA792_10095 [Bacteroidales bacterium]|nr:hypothetical protein [Bacteroidales bacterium]